VTFPARSIPISPSGFGYRLLTHRVPPSEPPSVDQVDERDVGELVSGAPRVAGYHGLPAEEADRSGDRRSSDVWGVSVFENGDVHPQAGDRSDSGRVALEQRHL